jgi:hypothetical protein
MQFGTILVLLALRSSSLPDSSANPSLSIPASFEDSQTSIQKQVIVGKIPELIIVVISFVLVCLEGVALCRQYHIKHVVRFALFKSHEATNSQSNFENFPETGIQAKKDVELHKESEGPEVAQSSKL